MHRMPSIDENYLAVNPPNILVIETSVRLMCRNSLLSHFSSIVLCVAHIKKQVDEYRVGFYT